MNLYDMNEEYIFFVKYLYVIGIIFVLSDFCYEVVF